MWYNRDGDSMKSVQEIVYHKLVIQKSIFHNYLIPVESVEHALDNLNEIKQKHPGANHYCYAYIIGLNTEYQKYNDDGEPSKTAGMPMLDVLKKNDLTNVIAISVRFFGGIKLGAGGLIRAYAKGVAQTAESAIFTTLKTFFKVSLTISFDEIGHVEHFIRSDYQLLETNYTDGVQYVISLDSDTFETFKSFFINQTNGKANIEILETKTTFK